MITARRFADLREVPYTTVIYWLRKGALEGAEKQPIPFGRQGFVWQVPDDAPLPELPMGPKPKAEQGTKTSKKVRKTAKK